MGNIFAAPNKVSIKARLLAIGIGALESQGWKVEKIAKSGKSSLRQITRKGVTKKVTIRTTQDTTIAFPRVHGDTGWRTLDEVDLVMAVSVDDQHNPRNAKAHLIDGDEMRDRFNRTYAARKKAGHTIPEGQGVWLALYAPEAQDPPSFVGAGAGLKHPPIAVVPLEPEAVQAVQAQAAAAVPEVELPLTIPDAKRRLAATFGVSPDNIKITVEA